MKATIKGPVRRLFRHSLASSQNCGQLNCAHKHIVIEGCFPRAPLPFALGHTLAVLGPLCTVDCTAAVSASEKAGHTVAFSAMATPSNCSGSPTFAWNFGDGTATAAQQSTVHVYAKPGAYTWTLTVRSGDAIPCTKTGTIQIFGDPSRRRP